MIEGPRAWETMLGELPPLAGRVVLDLGCATGEQAAGLTARGARVIGIDMNEDSLARARARNLPGAEFRSVDLRSHPDLGGPVDGIWGSFAAAYFIDLPATLAAWRKALQPGGWIALIEIDDFFGHHPVSPRTTELLQAYSREGFAAGRYDFFMGRKLADHLERARFRVARVRTLEDPDLASDGPIPAWAREAWRDRFERMPLLRDYCGPEFEGVRDDLLGCLEREDHRAAAKVYGCLAFLEEPPSRG